MLSLDDFTSLTSFLLTYFITFSSVSIVDFKQLNGSWVIVHFKGLFHRTAFTKNGQATIKSKDPSVTRFGDGKNGEATDSDIAQIKAAYCGNTGPVTPTTPVVTVTRSEHFLSY